MKLAKASKIVARMRDRQAAQKAQAKREAAEQRAFLKQQREKHIPRWSVLSAIEGFAVVDQRGLLKAKFSTRAAALRFIKINGARVERAR